MYLTIDTSALIAVISNEPSRNTIIRQTQGFSLCAPASVHWEIGNAFSSLFKRRNLSLENARQALETYKEIPIKFIDIPMERALAIAHKNQIYAYDAYLIQCAWQTSTPLLTLDKKLISVAKELGIHTLEIEP